MPSIKDRRLMKTLFFKIFIIIACGQLPSMVCACEEKVIDVEHLLPGDIIFWKLKDRINRAGHVAVIMQAGANPKDLRISHSTDNPKYNKFVETYLPPSKKVEANQRYYFVVRIVDDILKHNFLTILQSWLKHTIAFSAKNEKLMNQWDDSMIYYPKEAQLKIQNVMFQTCKNGITENLKQTQMMCSEVIIRAFHKAFDNIGNKLSLSLQLDPILCPPSVMMFSLIQDTRNFTVMGHLNVPDFEFSGEEKKRHKFNYSIPFDQ